MSMKTAGIIRIVIGALVAIILTVVLVEVAGGNMALWNTFPVVHINGVGGKLAGNAVTASAGSAKTENVREIEVNWVAGCVTVQPGNGSEVTFSETCGKTLTDEQTMRYSVNDGKLSIHYVADGTRLLNNINLPAKELVITLPKGVTLEDLDIETTSADIRLSGVTASKIEAETASGRITAEDATAPEEMSLTSISGAIEASGIETFSLELDTTSGEIDCAGAARRVSTESVSGELRMAFTTQPDELKAKTVSGRVTVSLPEDKADFTARIETVSGDVRCEFPAVQDGGRVMVGNGSAEFRFNSVSGDIELRKLG